MTVRPPFFSRLFTSELPKSKLKVQLIPSVLSFTKNLLQIIPSP